MSSQPNDEGLPAAAVQILIDVFQRKNVGYNVKAVAIILVCGPALVSPDDGSAKQLL